MKKLLLAALLVSTNSFTKIQIKDNTSIIVDPLLKVTDTITDLTTKTVKKLQHDLPKKIEPYKRGGIGSILWTAFLAHYFKPRAKKETPL